MGTNTTQFAAATQREEVNHGLIIWVSCGALVCSGVVAIIIILIYLKCKNRNIPCDKIAGAQLLTSSRDKEENVNHVLLDKQMSVSVPEIPANKIVFNLGPSRHAYECVDLVSSDKSVNYSGYISRIDEEEIPKAMSYGKHEDDKFIYEVPKNVSKSDSGIFKGRCLGESKLTLDSSILSSFGSSKISSNNSDKMSLNDTKNNTDSSSNDYQVPQSNSPRPPLTNNGSNDIDTIYDVPSNRTELADNDAIYSNLPTADTYKNMVTINQDVIRKRDKYKRYDAPLKLINAKHGTPRSSFDLEQPQLPLSHNYYNTDFEKKTKDDMQKVIVANYSKDSTFDEETIYDVPKRVSRLNSSYSSSLPNILFEDPRENIHEKINSEKDIIYNIPSYKPPPPPSRSINLILASRDSANLNVNIPLPTEDPTTPRESFSLISPAKHVASNRDDYYSYIDTFKDKIYDAPSNVLESAPIVANENFDQTLYDVPLKVQPIDNQKSISSQFPTTDNKNTTNIYENEDNGVNQIYDIPSNKNIATNPEKYYDIPKNVLESSQLVSQLPTKHIATNDRNKNTTTKTENENKNNDPNGIYDIPSNKNVATSLENGYNNNFHENTTYDVPSSIPRTNNPQSSPSFAKALNKNNKTIVAKDNIENENRDFNGVIV